jgi:hypothetical protein
MTTGARGALWGTRATRSRFMKRAGLMKMNIWSSPATRCAALVLFFLAAAGPGVALAAGMGGSMGGGGGFHSSGGGGGGGGVGGGFRGGGSWNGGGSWHGGSSWRGGCCWGGPRFFVGVGAPFWWYPYGYAYTYPVPAYAPPVVVESAPQTYIQQGDVPAQPQAYWYYCQPSQTYYPYVKECPTGWLQVVPQTTPPSR